MTHDAERWNHDLHHTPFLLDALPERCDRVLDAGCGEGVLTRALAGRAGLAVGLDRDPPSLALAVAQGGARTRYVRGDLLAAPFAPASFDAVVSVATLHHVEAEQGLRALAALLRPGGRLAVVGLARSELPRDLPREAAAAIATRVLSARRGHWEHSAPTVWPPPSTYRETAALTAQVLPGAVFRRRLLWRWTLTWTAPGG